jgi:RNA recognition motif-containing protein
MCCAAVLHCAVLSLPQVVEVIVVRDRHSGESKGFGFVRMGSEQGAAAALQALDNYLIGEPVRIWGGGGEGTAEAAAAAALQALDNYLISECDDQDLMGSNWECCA